MMKALHPTVNHHENVHKLCESLRSEVGAIHQEGPGSNVAVPEPMEVDTPLKNVLRT